MLDKTKFYLLRVYKNHKLYNFKTLKYLHTDGEFIHFSDMTNHGKFAKIKIDEFPEYDWVDDKGNSFKQIVTLN